MKHLIDQNAKQYILDCIDLEYYDTSATGPKDAALKVINFIMQESDQRIANPQDRIASHLMGLPSYINIEFQNYEILLLAVKFGSLDNLDDDKKNQNILDNWFKFIAAKLIQISNGYHVKGLVYNR